MKYSKLLFGFMLVFGIALLAWLLVGMYLNSIDALSILPSLPSSELGVWSVLVVGIVALTVGIGGFGRQHSKNHRNLLTVLVVILVPLLTFAIILTASVLTVVYAPMFPLRSEITQVTVVNTGPLILSLNVKAITSRDTRIDSALILSQDDNLVTEYNLEPIIVVDYYKHTQTYVDQPICELPGGSEITLTLNFNTTLPSGNYTVRLSSWGSNHGSSPFTIP
jgi:hypothetical protein